MPQKTLIHTGIVSSQPLRRLVDVLTSFRSFLVKMFKTRSFFWRDHRLRRPLHLFIYLTRRNKKNKIHCGSFRMHYNWCSSRSWSVPPTDFPTSTHVNYDSTWQCGPEMYNHDSSELSGYLRWLEEKRVSGDGEEAAGGGGQRNEIDELADVFIAQCREKFILEKQESDRRFKDMLARSM